MKKLIKKALCSAVTHLPAGLQRTLMDRLVDESGRFQFMQELTQEFGVPGSMLGHLLTDGGRYQLLQELALDYGISDFVVRGDCGYIQGSVADTALFGLFVRRKTWTSDTVQHFGSFLKNGGTYLDIGGNIGLTTIPIAKNPLVQCHAFEPEPNNFRLLKSNVTINCPHDNVTLYNEALFDRESTLAFEISPINSGDHRVRMLDEEGEYGEKDWDTIEVPARPLDQVGLEISQPLAAKIDTQGAEPFVIAGGREVLSSVGLLAMEFWPYGLSRMGGDPKIVIDFLRDHFPEGSITRGDKEEKGDWQPMAEIVSQLEELIQQEMTTELGCFDLLARK